MAKWRMWILVLLGAVAGEDCVWDKDGDFPPNSPLIMDLESWSSVLPFRSGSQRAVTLPEGAEVVIACPGTSIKSLKSATAQGICIGGNFLQINEKNFKMDQLGCKEVVKEAVQETGPCDADKREQEYRIGFDVPGYDFYTLIDLCFDKAKETTLYTHHILRGNHVSGTDKSDYRPTFKSSRVFTVSVNQFYKTSSQTRLFADLGLSSKLKGNYLSRGHLSPDADFMTQMEADATYYFVNVVPQWQAINNGNWKRLEAAIRNLADAQKTNLHIWTGIWGVLDVEDKNSNSFNLYLGMTESKTLVPVPAVIWKVVYNEETESGIAVLGVNSPVRKDYIKELCSYKAPNGSEICSQIPWMDFDFTDVRKGRLYCCSVHELKKAVPYVPDLGKIKILV